MGWLISLYFIITMKQVILYIQKNLIFKVQMSEFLFSAQLKLSVLKQILSVLPWDSRLKLTIFKYYFYLSVIFGIYIFGSVGRARLKH